MSSQKEKPVKPMKSESGAKKNNEKPKAEAVKKTPVQKRKNNTSLKNTPELSGNVKGLDYFINFSKLIDSKNTSLRQIYQGVVDLIPPAWQYPENTCAKLAIDGREFATNNFKESQWQQRGDIVINNKTHGFLVVGYLKTKPEADEGPFLKEERYLLDAICERVSQVTVRRHLETQLQEDDVKYRTLVDEVNDGIYICDTNGTFIYANRALAVMLGLERPADVIGKRFMEFLPPEKAKVLTEQYRNSMSTGINSDLITTEVIKPDGTNAFIEIKPKTFITSNKLMVNQGVVRDITERKQTEIQYGHQSTHDSLTGLYNRNFFDVEMKRLERGRQFPICIVVVEVEKSKSTTDAGDLQAGDKHLKRVAQVLFSSFRGDDIIARIGENVFALLLTKADENTADEAIRRIRKNFQKMILDKSGPAFQFYIGACVTKKGAGLISVLKQAEELLYLDKKKNQTGSYSE